jgi:hypothetical protein
VNIIDEDGFEIPVSVWDIIVVSTNETYKASPPEPVAKNRSMKVEKVAEPSSIQASPVNIDGDDYELLLAFIPKNEETTVTDAGFDLYFINDSPFYCMYAVSHRTVSGKLKLLNKSDAEPDTKEYVCSLTEADLNSKLNLNIVCFFYKHKEYQPHQPEQIDVNVNPVKLMKKSSFTENDFFEDKAYILKIATSHVPAFEIKIDPKALEKAIKQKQDNKIIPPQPAPKSVPEIEEIDLHIEELVETEQGMDNGDIFRLQIAHFTKELERGLNSGIKRMVFIHGVGNGKLKREIIKLLNTHYAGRVHYQDASFKEYGYGATMVILN